MRSVSGGPPHSGGDFARSTPAGGPADFRITSPSRCARLYRYVAGYCFTPIQGGRVGSELFLFLGGGNREGLFNALSVGLSADGAAGPGVDFRLGVG
jgi:hypothetical protein